jgi:hypothetical protein
VYWQIPRRPDGNRPIDLLTVYAKIHAGTYVSLSNVWSDVEEAWVNGEELDKAAMQILTAWNRIIFQKERIRCGLLTPSEWGSRVSQLRARMSTLLENPPTGVTRLVQTEFLPRSVEKPQIPFIEAFRYRAFLVAMDVLSEEVAQEVIQLAQTLEPEKVEVALKDDRPLNLAALKPGTFVRLEERAKQWFEEEGIAYPV